MPRKITALEEYQPQGNEPAARLPVTSKAKRNRTWEREQREKPGKVTVTYRNIPVSMRDTIKEIAAKLNVNVDDVARAFLEYGIQAFEEGDLVLNPTLKRGRFGLFGKED